MFCLFVVQSPTTAEKISRKHCRFSNDREATFGLKKVMRDETSPYLYFDIKLKYLTLKICCIQFLIEK